MNHQQTEKIFTDEETLVSIDPGSCKTGFAVLSFKKEVLLRKIVPTDQVEIFLKACINRYKPAIIIMGTGTWSKKLRPCIEGVIEDIPLVMVDEKHSTERARLLFYKENPPKGLWRLVPITMQVPKEPYDDYAAIILAEDYIDKSKT
jgi:hypothetical protein